MVSCYLIAEVFSLKNEAKFFEDLGCTTLDYRGFLSLQGTHASTCTFILTPHPLVLDVIKKLVLEKHRIIFVDTHLALLRFKDRRGHFSAEFLWELRALFTHTLLFCAGSMTVARSYWFYFGRSILPAVVLPVFTEADAFLAWFSHVLDRAPHKHFETTEKTMLIYKNEGGLGDIILSLPAMKQVLTYYPNAKLAYASWVVALLKAGKFYPDRLVSLDDIDLQQDLPYEQVLDVYNYTKHHSGKDFGSRRQLRFSSFKCTFQHVKHHYAFAVARCAKSMPLKQEPYPYLTIAPFQQDRPYLTIHPGAGYLKKCWPASHFLALIHRLSEQFPGLEIKLIYGEKDPRLPLSGHTFQSKITSISDMPLYQVASLIKGGVLHIGNDSGITHVVGAMDHPLVTIFGPTGPGSWSPNGTQVELLWGKGGVCFEKCNYIVMESCADQICLNRLSPERVYARVLRVLQRLELGDDKGVLISNPVVKTTIEKHGIRFYNTENQETQFLTCEDDKQRSELVNLLQHTVALDQLKTESQKQLASWLIEHNFSYLVPVIS